MQVWTRRVIGSEVVAGSGSGSASRRFRLLSSPVQGADRVGYDSRYRVTSIHKQTFRPAPAAVRIRWRAVVPRLPCDLVPSLLRRSPPRGLRPDGAVAPHMAPPHLRFAADGRAACVCSSCHVASASLSAAPNDSNRRSWPLAPRSVTASGSLECGQAPAGTTI